MCKHLRKLVAVVGVMAAVGTAAIASADPQPGMQELSLAGSFVRPIGAGGGTFDADFTYGYFLDDPAWQVGVRQGFNYNYDDDEEDLWLALTTPFIEYYLGEDLIGSRGLFPFVGGQLGAVWNDDEFTGTIGPTAGLKFYLENNAFVVARYRYEWFFDDVDQVNETLDATHVVTIGVGFGW